MNISISLQEKKVGYLLVQNIRRGYWGTGGETTAAAVHEDFTHVGIENVRYIVWRQTYNNTLMTIGLVILTEKVMFRMPLE